jgi:ketose-bisphosphate aldolase
MQPAWIDAMLIPFKQLLDDALSGSYAVGYFESWDVYSLEAVLEAAEAEHASVILGFGGVMMEPTWLDHGGLERLAALGLETARSARVPVAFLLNEVTTFVQIVRGLRAGFNAVMLDSSALPYAENVQVTRQIVAVAHAVGAAVEAELGELPDASGEMGGGSGDLTDPDQAARFVAETGIDALAVSVGNVHTLTHGKASIDWDRLAAIHQALPVPLVIHGGTGFDDEDVARAISWGVAKFNYGTVLKRAFLEGVSEAMSNLSAEEGYHQVVGSRKTADVLQQGKVRVRAEVAHRIRVLRR